MPPGPRHIRRPVSAPVTPESTWPRWVRQSPTTHPPGRPVPPNASAACAPAMVVGTWPAHPRGARAPLAAALSPTPSPTPCLVSKATHWRTAAHPPPLAASARLLLTQPRYPGPQRLPPPEPAAGTLAKAIPTRPHCSCPLQHPRHHPPAGTARHPCRAPRAGPPPGRPGGHTDHGCTNRRRHLRPPRRRHGHQGWCQQRHRATRSAVARQRDPRLAAPAVATARVGLRWRRWKAHLWRGWPRRHH